jgi:hypothetical protein
MLQIKVGCDPELFLSLGNRFVSAHGMFPGTKLEPHKVEKGAVQVDGLALEFNIDPAETPEEFDYNIELVLKQMKEMVKSVDKGLKLNFIPLARFDVEYFKDLPTNAKVLGCDPDFSARDGTVIVKSTDLTEIPLRTAAGHVHIGWTKDEDAMSAVHFEDARYVANEFHTDWGAPIRNMTQGENERLRYYGGFGAFRPKSYGVELRQFSNLWVEKPHTRQLMFNYVTRKSRVLYKG